MVTGAALGEVDGSTWELHHRVPGGMGGSSWDRDRLDNVIALLPRVHNLAPDSVHGNPAWSGPRGWLLPAREREPGSYPLLHWQWGWVFLNNVGGYVPVR